MNSDHTQSPAVLAAQAADAKVATCIQDGSSFLLEAGAGAGKTYSLVETIKVLLAKYAKQLRTRNQQIACITYTNAATQVISGRIDGNPLVYTDTIHAFCWQIIRGFQSSLKHHIQSLPAWEERLAAGPAITNQVVEYDVGHRRLTDSVVSLHHDDVLKLTAELLSAPKFVAILAAKFPFILIDEYQDTNLEIMAAIMKHLVGRASGPLVGLFGDHWQRIYENTCGHVSHLSLVEIGKGANFRSGTAIVSVLNRMRPQLTQAFKDESFVGSATVFHTNSWSGTRRTGSGGGHWKGDLPADVAHKHLESLMQSLTKDGWDFSPTKTKVLMLTHNVLAGEQGYATLAKVFPYADQFVKKEDDYIAFFADRLEPACEAFLNRRYGEMFDVLGTAAPSLTSHLAKSLWKTSMTELLALRQFGTIGALTAHIAKGGYIALPDAIAQREEEANSFVAEEGKELPERVQLTRDLREVPYKEMISLNMFINGYSPFATKHSVKGDEFENVLVVVGRGWNRYNFDQFLEWAGSSSVPGGKADAYERNRNLFYVACSRPTSRLALLFTQELSSTSMKTLTTWFGNDNVRDFSLLPS